MPTYVIPPDTRAIGTGNPAQDVNELSDMEGLLAAVLAQFAGFPGGSSIPADNAANVTAVRSLLGTFPGPGLAPSGDTTGATDPGLIQSLLNLAGKAPLQSGTFYLGGSSALALSSSGAVLDGNGYGLTAIEIVSAFSGAEAVSIAAPNCTVRDLTITASSSTISSNPACNGIEVQGGSYQVTLRNLFFSNVNGWAIEAVNVTGHPDISHALWDNIMIYDTAGGIHFNGNQATVGTVISNLQIGNIGTGTGPNANLDAFFAQDAFDIIMTGGGLGVGNLGTGHCMHFKGTCANIWVVNADCGGYPEPLAKTQCGIFVEDDTNGSSNGLRFIGGVLQTFGIGAEVSGAASNIWFTDMAFDNNLTHGSSLTGTGSNINFMGCSWGEAESNGQAADGGTYYDFSLTGSPGATGYVRSSRMCSPVVAAGTAGVQGVTAITGGTAMMFEHVDFLGASSSIGNIFTNQPNFVRDCRNYNPHGAATVSVPASGSATSALHYDAFYYITPGTGGLTILRNTNGNGGGAGPSMTLPAGVMATIFVRAGTNLTYTYTNAPTHIVDGN